MNSVDVRTFNVVMGGRDVTVVLLADYERLREEVNRLADEVETLAQQVDDLHGIIEQDPVID